MQSYRRQRIVKVTHRVVFGAAQTIESILANRGGKINTAFIERLNLDLRQHVAALGRRVKTLCKHEVGLRQQLALFPTYHNFVLAHASLPLPLPEVEMISATGSIKRGRQQTPAMAAGLTDHIWSLRSCFKIRMTADFLKKTALIGSCPPLILLPFGSSNVLLKLLETTGSGVFKTASEYD